jgi:diguanylate cyclase (GGDEF)-like protein
MYASRVIPTQVALFVSSDPAAANPVGQDNLECMNEPSPNNDIKGEAVARNPDPKGVLVVDRAGWIRAADAEAKMWICERLAGSAAGPWHLADVAADAGLEEKLERLFTGANVPTSVALLPNVGETPVEASIRWTLLSGQLGHYALLVINPHFQGSPSTAIDALTQIPDRRAIPELVDRWRRDVAPAPPRFAVLFVDFNDFKVVNDQHGHAVGDLVLKTLADRLQMSIRDGDLAARYGGDEFVLLIYGATLPAEVEPVLARITAAIQDPIHVAGLTLQLTATIGWSAPQGGEWTTESLIAAADADMYARKRAMLR